MHSMHTIVNTVLHIWKFQVINLQSFTTKSSVIRHGTDINDFYSDHYVAHMN